MVLRQKHEMAAFLRHWVNEHRRIKTTIHLIDFKLELIILLKKLNI